VAISRNRNAPAAAKHTKGTSKKLEKHCNKSVKTVSSNLSWTDSYELSQEEINEIADPKWIIRWLIISGHIILIPAEPNAGKTTIMMHLARDMAQADYQVFYVNADISGGDAKPMVEQAKASGFKLLLPDMKVGLSMDTVIKDLTKMSESKDRFDDSVFIFDTVKKMVDVISKSRAKEFFKLFRKLSAKGMTIILLAHTNKYQDAEGNPIYEGTGDMRSDVDELIYLIPQKHDDGSMTVTTKPDKQRGNHRPISFKIDSNRKVTQLNNPVDTVEANKIDAERKNDEKVIQAISTAISSGSVTQKDIVEYCKQHDDISVRAVKSVLQKYAIDTDISLFDKGNDHVDCVAIWRKSKGDKNSHIFSFI
jgi:hypothetical protein